MVIVKRGEEDGRRAKRSRLGLVRGSVAIVSGRDKAGKLINFGSKATLSKRSFYVAALFTDKLRKDLAFDRNKSH